MFSHGNCEISDGLFQVHLYLNRLANFVSDSKNINIIDLLHLDISNDANTIADLRTKCCTQLTQGKHILFEGGSIERDSVEWMRKYNKQPINSIRPFIQYEIIADKFPSISKLTHI
jgi:hypothetical protein